MEMGIGNKLAERPSVSLRRTNTLNTDSDIHPSLDVHANSNTNYHTYGNGDSDVHANCNSDDNPYKHTHTNSYFNTDGHSNRNADINRDSDSNSYPSRNSEQRPLYRQR